jgi:methyltransferase (TIGR00027 family)
MFDIHNPISNKTRPLITTVIFLAAVLSAGQARAVDPGKISNTAEAVCAFRSIGATDPDLKTRNPDHMANLFLNPGLQGHFPGLGLPYEDAKTAMDWMNNGVFYYVNARTLHMDALLTRALQSGFSQVVVLGAGFDSRAYRFHPDYPEVRFYEIDLPATSEDKQRRVQAILGRVPDWVTFVAIDFNTQTLETVLTKAGFAADRRTFYLWEGVTYFISEAGVDHTLRFVADHSAPGSQIVFDYMLSDVVQGTDYSAYGARTTVYQVALMGEPYVFGIDPHHLKAFMNLRGLELLSDLGPQELTRHYLIRSNDTVSGKIAGFLRIVHAQVPELDRRNQLRHDAQASGASVPGALPEGMAHRVTVPDDVQTFLKAYSDSCRAGDLPGMLTHFSDQYRLDGLTKQAVAVYLQRACVDRPVLEHRIVLTQYHQNGNSAKIDGYIQHSGYRTPLMTTDIAKEADGRWRWYGNHK